MRKFRRFILGLGILAGLTAWGCGSSTDLNLNPAVAQVNNFTVFAASGAANVTARVAEFQNALGGANNGGAALQPTGQRSVNWDGGIVPFNVNTFPSSFFNVNSTRGLVVGTAGNGLRADNAQFAAINANYPAQFTAFSTTGGTQAMFSPTTSNILWARFEGSNLLGVPASTVGFGAVFCDVDTDGSTSLEFFNGETSLGVFNVPVRTDANGHSFLGVTWQNGVRVTSVRLKLGNGTIGAAVNDVSLNAANPDLVVVDDFFYGEPSVVN